MASGTFGATAVSGERNIVAQIAQLSWDKIKSAEKMAGAEKKYAKKKLGVGEEGGLTQEEFSKKYGRGSFFRKALGSQFGGDKIARNRGRVESFFDKDVPGGRDATKSRQGRYREGFNYPDVEPKNPIVGRKPKAAGGGGDGERKSTRSSRAVISEAMTSALAGIEIQLTRLSEKFTNTVSVPEGLTEIINKQSQVITTGFDGLSKALYTLLGSIQKQTATMVRLDQEQKNLDAKNLDRQQALDEESALEGMGPGAGNFAAEDITSSRGGKGGGGGILGKMFGASVLARKIGRRGAGRAGVRAAAALGGRGAAKFMTKGTAKAFGKAGLKSGLKKIPLLGLGVGAFFAAQRAMKGDMIGAGLELASGAASIVPGAGTAASLGVDGVLAARDAGVVPFAKGGMVTKPTLGIVGEGKDPELITPWNKKTFDMMNKARLDAIQKNKNKFAIVQAEGLKEYFENRGGWQKFGEMLVALLKGAGLGNDDPPPPPPGDPPGDVVSTAPGEAQLAAFVATMESSTPQDQADVVQSMVNRAGQNYDGNGGLFGQLTAENQYSPLSAAIHGTTDPAAQAKYGPVADKLGATPQERIEKLKEIISQPDGLAQLQSLFGGISSASMAKTLVDDFYAGGPLSTEAARLIQGRTDFGAKSGVGGALGAGQIKRTSNIFGAANASKGASLLTSIAPQSEPEIPQKPISSIPEENQLGQSIAKNYGMDTEDKRYFTVPGYGTIEAYKTTKGFDFFKDGQKLSMHPSRPQAKAIYEYFIETNGGRKIDSSQSQSSLLQESDEYSRRKVGKGYEVSYVDLNVGGGGSAVPQTDSATVGPARDSFVNLSLDVRNV